MGFYSRWGSIISLSVLEWGCIENWNWWGCNQEWGSNRADTVVKSANYFTHLIVKHPVVPHLNGLTYVFKAFASGGISAILASVMPI